MLTVPVENWEIIWSGNSRRIEKDGQSLLWWLVPWNIVKRILMLAADSRKCGKILKKKQTQRLKLRSIQLLNQFFGNRKKYICYRINLHPLTLETNFWVLKVLETQLRWLFLKIKASESPSNSTNPSEKQSNPLRKKSYAYSHWLSWCVAAIFSGLSCEICLF